MVASSITPQAGGGNRDVMGGTGLHTLHEELFGYRHVVVRDLAWMMLSPGLLNPQAATLSLVSDAWCRRLYQAGREVLAALDQQPDELHAWLADVHSPRLGIYAEALLGFWLQRVLRATVCHRNVRVYAQATGTSTAAATTAHRHTLGEFDVLFSLPGDPQLYHWEVAVKFYLWHAPDGIGRWIGPAATDRLDIKLRRLEQHQLRLAGTAEGAATLAALGLERPHPAAFLKGYVFYPWDMRGCAAVVDATIATQALRGGWLRSANVSLLDDGSDCRWCLLAKRQWLAPLRVDDAAPDVNIDLLWQGAQLADYCRQHFAHSTAALLFARLEPAVTGWREVERCFVVSPHWPFEDDLPEL